VTKPVVTLREFRTPELFIVRSLTQGHGGRVWAKNREGGGAAVTFTLPLRREGSRTPG
jgi:signal transduction histidine kinase